MTRLEAAAAELRAALDQELAMIAGCLEALGTARTSRRRRHNRKRRFWTAAENGELRRIYPDTATAIVAWRLRHPISSVQRQAQKLGVHKSRAFLASLATQNRLSEHGRRYQYPKGHVPANKGLRRPGWGHGRMKQTWFRKGELAGAAQKKWVPIGTEVRDEDGYLKRKISDDRSKASRFNWKFVHTLLWEEKHGPVPAGHALAFKNGDKTDVRLENLELVSRRELMRRNSVHNLPKELAEVVQLRGVLTRQIHKRERERAQAS